MYKALNFPSQNTTGIVLYIRVDFTNRPRPSFGSVSVSLCESGWTPSNPSGTCVRVYDQTKSWVDARETCKADGGDMVIILSADMNRFVWGIQDF